MEEVAKEVLRFWVAPSKFRGLVRLCQEEMRPIPYQLRLLVQQALQQRELSEQPEPGDAGKRGET